MKPALRTRWLGKAWRSDRECGSTNDEALAWANAGAPTGAVVIAQAQSRGRGRQGRMWLCPEGENLYFSCVLRPHVSAQQCALLPLVVGVAVADALTEFGATPELKWPNDVLLHGKKVAGILVEAHWHKRELRHVIAGIGVNLNAAVMPPPLAATATSLARVLGRDISMEQFAAALCLHLEERHDRWVGEGPESILSSWRTRATFWGKSIELRRTGAAERVVALDLDPTGALLVRNQDGQHERIWSGEMFLEVSA